MAFRNIMNRFKSIKNEKKPQTYEKQDGGELKWEEVKIFISSTFKDMHAERDYLITEVFPEMREWCRKRRIILTDIDLRWGVTPEDALSGNTINVCLKTIDQCHPFFLCFIGQRRGWIPDDGQKVDPKTFENYPKVRDYMGNLSITEMEIEHATLAPLIRILQNDAQNEYAKRSLFFYRRNPFKDVNLTSKQREIYFNRNPEDDAKLSQLKDIIRKHNRTFDYACRWDENLLTYELAWDLNEKGRLCDFTHDGKPLKDLIVRELKKQIEEEFPFHRPVEVDDAYLEDGLLQNIEAESLSREFIGRKKELEYLDRFIESDSQKPLLVLGEEGMGKSKLLCRWNEMLKERGVKSIIRIAHSTLYSNMVEDLYLSIGSEAGLFKAEDEMDSQFKNLNGKFFERLKDKGISTLIICGFDKLIGPKYFKDIPEGFNLILTSQSDVSFSFDCEKLHLEGFENEDEEAELIENYMQSSLKNFSKDQMDLIISNNKSMSPLFLNILLNELKSFGSYEMVDEKIKKFGNTIESAFEEVLKTLEENPSYPENFVVEVLLMLSYSRYGLSEENIYLGLLKLGYPEDIKSKLRIFLYHIKVYLNQMGGAYNVKHSKFRNVIIEKHLPLENKIRRVLVEIYKDEILNGTDDSISKSLTSVSTDIFVQLEELKDYDGMVEVFDNEKLLDGIFPSIYLMEYKNNTAYGPIFPFENPENLPKMLLGRNYAGESLRNTEEGRKALREISVILARKTGNHLRKTNSKYSKYNMPKHELAEELLKRGDGSFGEYQSDYYEIPAYCKASALYGILGLLGEEDCNERKVFINEYKKTIENGALSFMDYLSLFGNGQLGLSGSIELRADSAQDMVNILYSMVDEE